MPAGRDLLPGDDIYQIRIVLLGIEPEIWRRLLVPGNVTLRAVSSAILAAMGWDGSHLHEFRAGKKIYGDPDHDSDPYAITRRQDDRRVLLCEMLPRLRGRALYTYDFGDQWEHAIIFEKRLKPDPAMLYPVCTGGAMAGPPEDSGGIPGYSRMLEALADPRHAEYDSFREWLGEDLDPQAFSVEEVNRKLQRKKHRARRRPTGAA